LNIRIRDFAILGAIAVFNILAPFYAVEVEEKFDDVSGVDKVYECKSYSFLGSHVLR
jgi:hypothetical protein